MRQCESVGGEDLNEELQPTETKEDAEARNDLWSIEGDFVFDYVPTEESFPIQLKYLTWPELLKQIWMWSKKNISTIFWNVDGDWTLSDS